MITQNNSESSALLMLDQDKLIPRNDFSAAVPLTLPTPESSHDSEFTIIIIGLLLE